MRHRGSLSMLLALWTNLEATETDHSSIRAIDKPTERGVPLLERR